MYFREVACLNGPRMMSRSCRVYLTRLCCGLYFIQYQKITGFYIHVVSQLWHSTFGGMPVIEVDLAEAAPDPALLEVLI